ncbi:hypothetical protein TNCV_4756221 [Trichonephila clavipes]|nr:hypothetical protein TNCV_4756221 [Trichonephila clavipes]
MAGLEEQFMHISKILHSSENCIVLVWPFRKSARRVRSCLVKPYKPESFQDEQTDKNGALRLKVIQAVLFWCLVVEKISKKTRGADGSCTS